VRRFYLCGRPHAPARLPFVVSQPVLSKVEGNHAVRCPVAGAV